MQPGTTAEGLTTEEAHRRLQSIGANALPDDSRPLWGRVLEKFSAPVPWMLEIAIILQFTLHEYAESAVIAALLLFNAVLGLIQEGRAQATLDALKSRLPLRASVRRDGEWRTVLATELVPGDLIKLTLGGIVPADVTLLEGNALLDQSMLTGESLPIEAGAGAATFAGALVRRGEALARVAATGGRTRFGRTAQLVSIAHGESSQQQAVLRVVRNLAAFSAAMVVVQVIYATARQMPPVQLIPLTLTAILAAIPVALPASFTLASALAARTLAGRGVLPTRLSAIDEAGTMDVLCSDKTGTLTANALTVASVHAVPGYTTNDVLTLAALASAEGGLDPVDCALRAAAREATGRPLPHRITFVPFDPARKLSEAQMPGPDGRPRRIIKGAIASLETLIAPSADLRSKAAELQGQGCRVLAVAAGPVDAVCWAGLIALSDPPRADAARLVSELRSLGVEVLMVTGDAPATAGVVAQAVGLSGPIYAAERMPERLEPRQFAVFAGVFPEDKFHIVRALQSTGHSVGMCGDGANDAPALRQAQMGVAVSSATDVAKSAAGLVLTQSGLGGIVDAVHAGRVTYQRILTYVLRSVTTKINQMLFLTVGLLMTGHAILTPMLMVIVMISGDFLAMSATTDRVGPTTGPNAWRIGRITAGAIVLAAGTAVFCCALLALGWLHLGLENHGLRTFAAVTLVCSSQAIFYVVRDRRRLWSSRPSGWVVLSSVADVSLIAVLAGTGTLMHSLPWSLIGMILVASIAFAVLLDSVKAVAFARLRIA